jgi:phenylacetic acid degradation operon negative regulatory protein
MRRDGQLDSVRHGRTADYALTGAFLESFLRVRDTPGRRPAEWTGSFHAVLYQVPESHRAYRDALRRNALLAGFGMLQPGTLISLTDRTSALGDLFDTAPSGASVYRARLAMDAADAAQAAWDAWGLAEVSEVYNDHITTLSAALDALTSDPPASVETLRRFTHLARLPFVDTLRDPGLPPELVPQDWPGPRLRELTVGVSNRFGPPANAYVRSLLS